MSTNPPAEPTPPPDPISALFHSRKFLVACAGVLMTVLGLYAKFPHELLIAIDGLLAVLIGAIAHEDANKPQ